MLRRLIFAAAVAVISAGSARAQVTPLTSGLPEGSYWALSYGNSRTPEQVGREVEIERDYREAVKKIPDKKPTNDPWKTVRTAPARPAATATSYDRHRAE
jgi:hypothetical protein